MAVQIVQDFTNEFNTNNGDYNFDVGGWDYVVVQLVSPSGAITFLTTNDAGAITGVSDGSAVSATNFIEVQGTNLNSGTAVTSLNASGLVRFQGIGQFLRLQSTAATVTKLILRFYKI